jgi:membrane dipeptidase
VLKALAERGGVIGITAYAPFCEKPGKGRPTLDDMIDHIAYVADKFGVDHVGIGSDLFEGESWVRFERFFRRRYPSIVGQYNIDTVYADGFGVVDDFAAMPAALSRRGFSEEDTAKILGVNFLRVFEGVWG